MPGARTSVPLCPDVAVAVTVIVAVTVAVAADRTVGKGGAVAAAVRDGVLVAEVAAGAVAVARATVRPPPPGSSANTTAENTASNATNPPRTARIRT